MRLPAPAWVLVASLWGCSDGGDGDETVVDPLDAARDHGDCPALFAQDVVAEYHVEIADSEWAALEDEFHNRAEREAAGLDPHPYHPIRFVHDSEEVPGVLLRLKGQSSWAESAAFDDDPKMQFVIAFNEVDPEARYRGLRKIELDMPRTDASFLRQRLGLYALRAMGQVAQCGNSARLFVNGDYYGLFTNLERLDKEFLQRHFGDDDEGDLWEGGRFIKTNDETFTWDRLDQFWNLAEGGSLEEFDDLIDLDGSMHTWAAEAMLPHSDGYYMGRPNFYLYDHPSRGFVWLPHDLDAAFDFVPAEISPILPDCSGRLPNDWEHYLMVVNDPAQYERYRAVMADVRSRLDADELASRVDLWAAQIADAAEDDPRRPFELGVHQAAIESLRDFPGQRLGHVDAWLACFDQSGPDGDGDGFDLCHDCDDTDSTVRPDAEETCDDRDEDCDGRIDDRDDGACA